MRSENAALRFTIPVIAENMITTAVGLIFSAILGGIGPASLAAAGVINQAMSFVVALFAVITAGTAVLTARMIGEGDRIGASEIAEHTILLSPVVSLVVTSLLLALSLPITRLLMPTADESVFTEGLTYFRVMLVSVPGLVFSNALGGVLRAAGESTAPLMCTVVSNAVQIGSVYLFVNMYHLGIAGTGYAYVACRYVSAILYLVIVLRFDRQFRVRLKEILRPKMDIIARILRIGLPAVLDAAAVQSGYVVSNSMLVSIGTRAASVYNVLGSVMMFPQLCQSFGNVITTTLVGHRLGSAGVKEARTLTVRLLVLLAGFSVVLCLPPMLFPKTFFGFFTQDEAILKDSIAAMWVMIPFEIVALGVNVCDPAARVGGETKYVMFSTIVCIWLIRLPLCCLFCRVGNMGAAGMYLANMIALTARTGSALLRILFSKWGSKAI